MVSLRLRWVRAWAMGGAITAAWLLGCNALLDNEVGTFAGEDAAFASSSGSSSGGSSSGSSSSSGGSGGSSSGGSSSGGSSSGGSSSGGSSSGAIQPASCPGCQEYIGFGQGLFAVDNYYLYEVYSEQLSRTVLNGQLLGTADSVGAPGVVELATCGAQEAAYLRIGQSVSVVSGDALAPRPVRFPENALPIATIGSGEGNCLAVSTAGVVYELLNGDGEERVTMDDFARVAAGTTLAAGVDPDGISVRGLDGGLTARRLGNTIAFAFAEDQLYAVVDQSLMSFHSDALNFQTFGTLSVDADQILATSDRLYWTDANGTWRAPLDGAGPRERLFELSARHMAKNKEGVFVAVGMNLYLVPPAQ